MFDGVQLCPRARQAIKSLVKDGRYDYVETGSLISIRKHTADILIPSEEQRIEMRPMDYEEFLWACGNEATIPLLDGAFKTKAPLGEQINRRLMRNFKLYLADTGLFVTLAFKDSSFTENVIYETLLADRLPANLGAVYENVVAQELVAKGRRLFYHTWEKEGANRNYEIDFILSRPLPGL